MPNLACIDLPALPLQLVWKQEPSLRAHPVVVIDHDRPLGQVMWACERARAAGVLVGQRYGHALSRCPGLQARVVATAVIDAAVGELRAALQVLSPHVEVGEPGTFWLDGRGLSRVFVDRGAALPGTAWSVALSAVLARLVLRGAVVVGFSRFATYAIARAQQLGALVFASDAEERRAAASVPLARLDLDAKLRDALLRLGIARVGELVRLPAGGILERFGRDAYQLYQLAAGERWDPLVPVAPPEAPDECVTLDDDITDIEQLMFVLRPALDRLLARLATHGRALTALHLELALRHAVGNLEARADCIRAAAPTLDARALLRLAHLRLSATPPAAPVHALRLWADDTAATREQLALFAAHPRRCLRAANEALARLRAELGDAAVQRAVLRDGHLPEATFAWESLPHLLAAAPRALPEPAPPLILTRRMLPSPRALPPQVHPKHDDGWLLSGPQHGSVSHITGPYILSGGWWSPHELHREYHFAELTPGNYLWVFYDRPRTRWVWQATVE